MRLYGRMKLRRRLLTIHPVDSVNIAGAFQLQSLSNLQSGYRFRCIHISSVFCLVMGLLVLARFDLHRLINK